MFTFRSRELTLALLALLALGTSSAAQCLGPDNLSGPCCTQTLPNLPSFDQFDLPGTTICWSSCVAAPQELNRIRVSKPVPTNCTQYTSGITVTDAAGAAILGGTLVMDYTRTWLEASPTLPPSQLQVYRFAVKIDMLQLQGGVGMTPCNTPTCLPGQATAFYYGYMDYAYDCASGVQSNVLVLFHNCDSFIHRPGLSSKPGAFHPTTTYALVWPSTTVNPFVASSAPAAGGPLIGEATRLQPPAGVACITEDFLSSGSIFPLGSGCGCPFMPGFTQLTGRDMNGVGTCPDTTGTPGNFGSLNPFPTFPWFEVMTTSIGAWTTMASYPGTERAWVDEGVFLVNDACSDVVLGQKKFIDINYGGSTANGYPVLPSPINPTITADVTDMAANASIPRPGPIIFPLVGAVRPTRSLLYLNF